MKINYLKDRIFDFLNDNSEELGISMADGSVFEIKCRRILEREDEWAKESWLYMLGAEKLTLTFHRLSCRESGWNL